MVLVGRREATLQQAVAQLGHNAGYELYDVTQTGQADSFIADVTQRVDPISIVVNNAGIHLKKVAVDTTDEDFLLMLQTHILGAFSLTRAVIPQMAERQSDSILFMASMTLFMGLPQVVTYATAKSGYLGLVRTLATELAPQGIRVNAIAPGWIETDMLHQALEADSDRKQRIISRIAMPYFGWPEDVGWAAVYLSSPAANYVTGTVLPVDGGAVNGF